jgi:hypothetical protein
VEAEFDEEWESFDPLADVEKFLRAGAKTAAAFRSSGRRSPLWEGSPVKSSRFA